MSEHDDEKNPHGETDREAPEVGLIADEDLPGDLRPTDDNPLAQDPGEGDEGDDEEDEPSSEAKVEGLPDMGSPA